MSQCDSALLFLKYVCMLEGDWSSNATTEEDEGEEEEDSVATLSSEEDGDAEA